LSSGLNALFRGTEVVNHPFYSVGPKIMFGCVSEHFTNLRQVKRCRTCVLGLNAMFRGTELWSIHSTPLDPNWCSGVFQSISLSFNTKKMQNLRLSLNAQFWDTEAVNNPFYSIGPKMMFGSVSEHLDNIRQVKDAKLVFRDYIHSFEVAKLWSIHSTPLDRKWCFRVFRSISLTFDR
jgi:hypothetical protein